MTMLLLLLRGLVVFSFPLVLFLPVEIQAQSAAATEPVIRHPQVGVGLHLGRPGWDPDKIIPLVAASGATWVRDSLAWKELETSPNVYQIPKAKMDQLQALHAAGLKIDLIVYGSNSLYAPDDYNPEAFAGAAAYAAKTLMGTIDAIEILNEPANFGFSKQYNSHAWNGLEADGTVAVWVKKYVELLNAAAKAIKAVNPGVKVIGLGSVPPVNFRQLEMGIDPAVDGIVDHPYSFRAAPEYIPYPANAAILKRDGIASADPQGTFASLIQLYRERSARAGGPGEIWLTEWGWPTYQEAKAGGLYAGVTEETQAKYILRRLVESLGSGVDVTMIYDFKDDGANPYDAENNFGLLDNDLHPKPAYGALQRLTALLAAYRPTKIDSLRLSTVNSHADVHPITWDQGEIAASGAAMCYAFAGPQGRTIVAIWASERASNELKPIIGSIQWGGELSPSRIEAHDPLTGKSWNVPFSSQDGKAEISQISIPDAPLLLEFIPISVVDGGAVKEGL